jgi:MazG family protein
VALVARLRAPDGCPWDREQTLTEARGYLLEEAHELAAAIDAGEPAALVEELGDLLFQAAFVARLVEEAEGSGPGEAAAAAVDRVIAKMVERHPHVFGDHELPDAAAVSRAWERRKLAGDAASGEPRSHLAGVPASLPALLAAYRMTQKAAGVGFDWPEAADVLAKIDEELAELRAELAAAGSGQGEVRPATGDGAEAGEGAESAPPRGRIAEELGDLLFTVANLARKLDVDPEAALAATNRKFRRRFGRVEEELAAEGRRLDQASLDEMDALWERAKDEER